MRSASSRRPRRLMPKGRSPTSLAGRGLKEGCRQKEEFDSEIGPAQLGPTWAWAAYDESFRRRVRASEDYRTLCNKQEEQKQSRPEGELASEPGAPAWILP